jgi:pimeloyl-ACP methyl ester carboxylesterase
VRDSGDESEPLRIKDQGSFAVGGSVIKKSGMSDSLKRTPGGQTLHGDHAYVQYQIPANARSIPLVFLHGAGQFSKCWGSTPDGREGFQSIFLRRRFGVYLIDQPRRGGAGRSTLPGSITAMADDQYWLALFRLGIWPDFFPGVHFPAMRNP